MIKKRLEFLIVYNTNAVQEDIQTNMSQQQQMSLVIEINFERIIIIVKLKIYCVLINIINGCQTLLLIDMKIVKIFYFN